MPRTAVCLILSILFGVGPYGSTSVMGKPQIQIHTADMSYELQQEALQVASLAYNRYEEHSDMAEYIKKEFDKRKGGTWNCIVGNCALYVTHKTNGYINFSVGDTNIVLFRSA